MRAGRAPFSEEPLSSMRRTIAKRMSEAKNFLCMCVFKYFWGLFTIINCNVCLCDLYLSVTCVCLFRDYGCIGILYNYVCVHGVLFTS